MSLMTTSERDPIPPRPTVVAETWKTIQVRETLHNLLRREADENGTSMSWVLNHILENRYRSELARAAAKGA